MELFNTFISYLQMPFVRYAFIVVILLSICSAIVGVNLVLKRYSFIGDGLSHVAFGATAVASILSLTNNLLIVMPTTIIIAIILLKLGQNAKLKGDALIAILSVSALGVGYFLMNVFSTSSNVSGDVCSALFGSNKLLALNMTDVIISIVICVLIITLYLCFYNKIFSVTFDENYAKATGINTEIYNISTAVIIAILIVLAMSLIGSLLVSALIIFPALSSMRIFNSFKKVIISSAIFALISSFLGISISILFATPVGATIVVIELLAFIGFSIIGKIKR